MYWSKDHEGNPVVYDKIGNLRASDLMEAMDEDALINFHIHVMEHKQLLLDRLSRERGCLVFCYEIKVMSSNPNPYRHLKLTLFQGPGWHRLGYP